MIRRCAPTRGRVSTRCRVSIRRGVAGLLAVLMATGLAVLGFASPAAAHHCGSLTDCLPSGRSLLMALAAVLIVVGIVVLFSAFPPAGGAALALAGGGVAGSAGAISLSTVAAGTATIGAGIALAAAADGMPTGGGGSGGSSGGSSGSAPDPARSMNVETSQLQHAFKHAKDFGITGNWNRAAGEAFRRAIQNHVSNAQTQIIQGTYRGETVTHFYHPNTGLNVIRSQGGDFLSGWKLSPQQVQHLLRSGSLGGG